MTIVSASRAFRPIGKWPDGEFAESFETEAGSNSVTTDDHSHRLRESLSQLGILGPRDLARLPTFMIVSPPKTGTSWLFSRLLQHPRIAVPREKETRFFSTFYRWCDLQWYLSRYGDKPATHRGEATPTYSLLPPRMIETIHALMPNLKLIFLLRDPVGRAWSHARHNWRHGEANFAQRRPALEQMSDADWCENIYHPWPSISGDYLGQLRRWRAYFPREQIFIGFFEQMISQPEKLVGDVLAFLGIEPPEGIQSGLDERVNEGLAVPSTESLLDSMRHVYSGRTRQLADYLHDEFQLSLPDAWNHTLADDDSNVPELSGPMQVAAEHEFDNEFLSDVIQHEQSPVEPLSFAECYLNYNLFLFRQRVYALAGHLRPEFLSGSSASELEAAQRAGHCLSAESVARVKDRIVHVLLKCPIAIEPR
ncbi:MAG TPA: sulfotransferase [Pirellulales bacterium]|jgi:hypothetical protein|nr:sulfotransferase [Pirellulales bacterium]